MTGAAAAVEDAMAAAKPSEEPASRGVAALRPSLAAPLASRRARRFASRRAACPDRSSEPSAAMR
eukprot:CAMPEP_0185531712 /NCGR_PEP_ID=MMETSP1366-20130426/107395_1 /TAXON_ID=38817 /ORGANISM="Gephyrocapsa oceanica, Strain RCC1303" /LENGTH=64 /DNA_ID=CAMNT_0028143439 /DNA_START=55 /DNA_END=249 /DNA_ORIENTATION=-